MIMQAISIDEARAQGSTWLQVSSIAGYHYRAAALIKDNRALRGQHEDHIRLARYFSSMAVTLKSGNHPVDASDFIQPA